MGQLVGWLGGTSLVTGFLVGVSAYVSGLAPATIITLGLLSAFAVMGTCSVVNYWILRPKSSAVPLVPNAGGVGHLVEQYAVENAKRYEIEASQLKEELRETHQSREELQQQVTTLQSRLDASMKSAREMNDTWSKLAREAIDDFKRASGQRDEADQTLRQINATLAPIPNPVGLLGITPVLPTPQERIDIAVELVQEHQRRRVGAILLTLAKKRDPDGGA